MGTTKTILNIILIINLINSFNLITTADSKKEMKINSNLFVTGNVTSGDLTANDVTISGILQVQNLIKTKKISSNSMETKTLITEVIKSPTGVVTIQGDLILNNDVDTDTLNVKATSFIVQDVKQWTLKSHDDFESEASLDGWSDKRTNRCKGKNTHLGGHCNFSFNEVSKVYKNLTKHVNLRVNAAYHMFDSWEGETGYMKIDGEIVWTKQGTHSEKGVNICGGDYNDPAYNIPIDVTVPHDKAEVKVSFGSTLDEDACNESFGIDDVMIYLK